MLESGGIRATIEKNLDGMIPDIFIEYEDRKIICEVEESDLTMTNRIAKKMADYVEYPLIFLCRHQDLGKMMSLMRLVMGAGKQREFYVHKDGTVPVNLLPRALLGVSIMTYDGNEFRFFNGIEMVKFSSSHLMADSSFINRSRKLPLGALREQILLNAVEMISKTGKIDLDRIEEKFGKERLREMLQTLRERGYEELSVGSLLELDKLQLDTEK